MCDVPEPGHSKPCYVQSTAAAKALPKPHAQHSQLKPAVAPEGLPGQLHSTSAVSMEPLQHLDVSQSLQELAVAPQWLSGQLPGNCAADTQPLQQPTAQQSRPEAGLQARLPGGLSGNWRAQWQKPRLTEAAPHACISAPASFRGRTSAGGHLNEHAVGAVQQRRHEAGTETLQSSGHDYAAVELTVSWDRPVQYSEADSVAALAATPRATKDASPSKGKIGVWSNPFRLMLSATFLSACISSYEEPSPRRTCITL